MTQADTAAQGGLEQVAGPDRVASLTGIRAVAALLVVATHAAYTTGKYIEGYFGLVCARMEMGVPIFFVLSGYLLFRPWVKSIATRRPGSVGPPLRLAPGPADHAGLRRHRADRLRHLPLPNGRAQSRPHLDRVVPQSHVDADLHLQLPVRVFASGSDPDVESGGGSLVLRDSSAAGLLAVGRAVPTSVAAEAAAGRHRRRWR